MIKTVAVNDLNIDESYQRSLSTLSVKKMAKNFKVGLLALPLISVRSDGSMWVIDGQHRVAAAKLASVPTIDARLVSGLTQEEEAQMFVDANINSRRLTGANFFVASLRAGNPQIVQIARMYERYGYFIAIAKDTALRRHKSGQLAIKPGNTLIATWAQNPEANEAAVRCLAEAYPLGNGGRNQGVCQQLGNVMFIGAVTQVIAAYQSENRWHPQAAERFTQMLGAEAPTFWTSIPLDKRLLNVHANLNRAKSASVALWISKNFAKLDRKYRLDLSQVVETPETHASFARVLAAV